MDKDYEGWALGLVTSDGARSGILKEFNPQVEPKCLGTHFGAGQAVPAPKSHLTPLQISLTSARQR